MMQVVQVKLLPEPGDDKALAETLRACNRAANHVSRVAFDRRIWRRFSLNKVVYGELREGFGLGAQAAQLVVRKVADAYASGDKRWRQEAAFRRFRWSSAQPYDARNLSWDLGKGTISIWALHQRLKGMRFACAPWQLELLKDCPIGECDLVFKKGAFYLAASIQVEEEPPYEPTGFLGVDLGIMNIATTSDGVTTSGSHLNRVRHKNRHLRGKLQQRATRSSKRLLHKLSGREARFAKDTNHRISKAIVAEAVRTKRGIALENLQGISSRARSRKPQRATLCSWSFHQLGAFVSYKALRAGAPVVFVDPAYTSQMCSRCGHTSKQNRKDQSRFCCTVCGFVDHADRNAAVNIARRGVDGWAVSHAAARHTDRSLDLTEDHETAPATPATAPSSAQAGREATVTGKLALAVGAEAGKLGPLGPRS